MAFQKVNYVDNVTTIGAKNLNDIQAEFDYKLDKNFGPSNAGKFLKVMNDGTVAAESIPNGDEVSY